MKAQAQLRQREVSPGETKANGFLSTLEHLAEIEDPMAIVAGLQGMFLDINKMEAEEMISSFETVAMVARVMDKRRDHGILGILNALRIRMHFLIYTPNDVKDGPNKYQHLKHPFGNVVLSLTGRGRDGSDPLAEQITEVHR